MKSPTYNALLLVDGYNIIGQWDSLKTARDRYGLELARQSLVESLVSYSSHQGYLTHVVFDAQYQQAPASQEQINACLTIHFTAWLQTADTFIEKRCAQYSRNNLAFPSRLIVATSDRAQRLTVVGYGAEWMSANCLAQAVEQSRLQVQQHRDGQRQRRSRREPQRGKGWVNGLDPAVREKLSQWRLGMD